MELTCLFIYFRVMYKYKLYRIGRLCLSVVVGRVSRVYSKVRNLYDTVTQCVTESVASC